MLVGMNIWFGRTQRSSYVNAFCRPVKPQLCAGFGPAATQKARQLAVRKPQPMNVILPHTQRFQGGDGLLSAYLTDRVFLLRGAIAHRPVRDDGYVDGDFLLQGGLDHQPPAYHHVVVVRADKEEALIFLHPVPRNTRQRVSDPPIVFHQPDKFKLLLCHDLFLRQLCADAPQRIILYKPLRFQGSVGAQVEPQRQAHLIPFTGAATMSPSF